MKIEIQEPVSFFYQNGLLTVELKDTQMGVVVKDIHSDLLGRRDVYVPVVNAVQSEMLNLERQEIIYRQNEK